MRRRNPVALAICLLGAASAQAQYRITTIATSRGELDNLDSPVINGGGSVAYSAARDAGGAVLVREDRPGRTVIADTDGDLAAFGAWALDDAGSVGFVADTDGGGRVVARGEGGAAAILAAVGSGGVTSIDPVVSMSPLGDLLYAATSLPLPDTAGRALYRVRGGVPTLMVADYFQYLSYGPIEARIALDDAGTVYFENQRGNSLRISETTSVPFVFDAVWTDLPCDTLQFATVMLLSAGPAYGAVYSAGYTGGAGIFIEAQSPTCATRIADVSGPLSSFAQAAAAYDRAARLRVAFHALLDAGGSALYAGEPGNYREIIAEGDRLDGSTVVELSMSAQAFNSEGELAFRARLADGTTGVYVASPDGGGAGGGGGGSAGIGTLLVLVLGQLCRARRGAARRWFAGPSA